MSRLEDRTTAFQEVGETRLAFESEQPMSYDRIVARLLAAMSDRVGTSGWIWAYGRGPDELALLRDCTDWVERLTAFQSDDECIAELAKGIQRKPLRLLALGSDAPVAGAWFKSFLRAGEPFWFADRDLGTRFRRERNYLSFRAHHPVMQQAVIDRCAEEGLRLLS